MSWKKPSPPVPTGRPPVLEVATGVNTAPLPKPLAAFVTALPPVFFLSPLALLGLASVRSLPRVAQWLLLTFGVTQLLPALFSPEPLLATVLAASRVALLTGLVSIGSRLQIRDLSLLAIGLGVTFITAVGWSLLHGQDLFLSRLTHPYMTSVTLSIAGAWGVWIAAFGIGRLAWRLPLGLVSAAILVLAGGRGALLAAGGGLIAGFIARTDARRHIRLLGAAMLSLGVALGALMLASRSGLASLRHLTNLQLNGRQNIWENVSTIVDQFPWTGVGPYRLGLYLERPGPCRLYSESDPCPSWLAGAHSPWLIAHNGPLHQFAESGPLGTLGLFALIGVTLFVAWRRREPLGVAALTGMLLTNVNDNTLIVPGPFIGEAFWLTAGIQLAALRQSDFNVQAGLLGGGSTLFLSLPLMALWFTPPKEPVPQSQFFYAPNVVASDRNYPVLAQLDLPAGPYLIALNSCAPTCRPIELLSGIAADKGFLIDWRDLRIQALPEQTLELRVYRDVPDALRAIGVRRWTVRLEPEALLPEARPSTVR